MSPSIRVDRDVYDFLRKRAEPFVDSPNSVLRRLLGLESEPMEKRSTRPQKRTSPRRSGVRRHAAAGPLLPQDEYVRPILDAIASAGGAAATQHVIREVGERLKSRFGPADREMLPTGGIRWQNRAQWVRLRLVEEGLLSKDSPRGVWAISDQGRERLMRRATG